MLVSVLPAFPFTFSIRLETNFQIWVRFNSHLTASNLDTKLNNLSSAKG